MAKTQTEGLPQIFFELIACSLAYRHIITACAQLVCITGDDFVMP